MQADHGARSAVVMLLLVACGGDVEITVPAETAASAGGDAVDGGGEEPDVSRCEVGNAVVTVRLDEAASSPGCSYGSRPRSLVSVAAAPEDSGIRMETQEADCRDAEGCSCSWVVGGVGTALAGDLARLAGEVTDSVIQSDRIELYGAPVCASCEGCACPELPPVFYAADRSALPLSSANGTIAVEQGTDTCRITDSDGCTTASYELRVSAYAVDRELGGASKLIASAKLAELEESELAWSDGHALLVTALRASGRSTACGATAPIGGAAWSLVWSPP